MTTTDTSPVINGMKEPTNTNRITAEKEGTMFDTDIHGTTIEGIADDLKATADYLLSDNEDSDAERRRLTELHVTAARSMLADVLDDIEDGDATA